MKLRTSLAVLAMLFLVPLSAHAGTVTIADYTEGHFAINSPNGGGAFLATTNGGPLGNRSFLTFCLEFNERITLGNTFDYELSDNAMAGGTGGGVNGDPLSDATKWLYYQTVGNNDAYVGLVTQVAGAGNLNNSGSYIQQAIWYLEQERTQSQISSYALALATLAISRAGEWAALSGLGHNVQAMNLENIQGVWKQDQIVWTFTPPGPPPAVPDGDLSTLAQLIGVAWLGAISYIGSRRMRWRTS